MPTPYGSRGGMAFSAAELRVLRRSLAHALQTSAGPLPAAEVRDCLRLAQAVDDAAAESGRLRAFLREDLRRYREALPGSAAGYLELLREAMAHGYEPAPEDLAGLRALRGNPAAAALLERTRPAGGPSVRPRPGAPVPRARYLTLAGGRDEGEPRPKPAPAPPVREPRPVPTPGEVFPPRRKPTPPPAAARAAG
ncbi:hypothetical protein [Streptomyces sp. NPDC012888]|uniref:hypothetical protein n=1 Tax=Streptomyces sp. NPDC012888 TaxID=3364855 RepID=UPI0036ADFE0B